MPFRPESVGRDSRFALWQACQTMLRDAPSFPSRHRQRRLRGTLLQMIGQGVLLTRASSRRIAPQVTLSRSWPFLALAGLLALCLLQGLRITQGVNVPADLDALRDIGFAQGLLDGNWFGDPAYADGVRYYPSEFDKLLLSNPALQSRE